MHQRATAPKAQIKKIAHIKPCPALHSANIIKIFRILKLRREQKRTINNLYT